MEVGPGTHLRGYFASWRYFPNVAPQVRDRILLSSQLSAVVREEAQRAHEEAAVALHARRGGYLSLASTYGHVAPIYYRRALAAMRSLGQEGPVWLFSDDPHGALSFLRGYVDVDRLIEPMPNGRSLDGLVTMSGASGLVIANSTYSWWAAFIRESPSRPVIAPRPTWADSSLREPRDALLPNWLTLDCRN